MTWIAVAAASVGHTKQLLYAVAGNDEEIPLQIVGKAPPRDNSPVYYLHIGGNLHEVVGCRSAADLEKLIGQAPQAVYTKDKAVLAAELNLHPAPHALSCLRLSAMNVDLAESTHVESLAYRYIPTGVEKDQFYKLPLDCGFDFAADLFKVTRLREVTGRPANGTIIELGCREVAPAENYDLSFDEVALPTGEGLWRLVIGGGSSKNRVFVPVCSLDGKKLDELKRVELEQLVDRISNTLSIASGPQPTAQNLAREDGCLRLCTDGCSDAKLLAGLTPRGNRAWKSRELRDVWFEACDRFAEALVGKVGLTDDAWEQAIEDGGQVGLDGMTFVCPASRCIHAIRQSTIELGRLQDIISGSGDGKAATCKADELEILLFPGQLNVQMGGTPSQISLTSGSRYSRVTIRGAGEKPTILGVRFECGDLTSPTCPGGTIESQKSIVLVEGKTLVLENIGIEIANPIDKLSDLRGVEVRNGGRLVLTRSSIDALEKALLDMGAVVKTSTAASPRSELFCSECSIRGTSSAVQSTGSRILISGTDARPATLESTKKVAVEALGSSFVRVRHTRMRGPRLLFLGEKTRAVVSDSVLTVLSGVGDNVAFQIESEFSEGPTLHLRCDQKASEGCAIDIPESEQRGWLLDGKGQMRIEDDVSLNIEGKAIDPENAEGVLRCKDRDEPVLLYRGRNFCKDPG